MNLAGQGILNLLKGICLKVYIVKFCNRRLKMKMPRTPKEALRAYCLHCVGDVYKEIESCDADKEYHICPFHPFRLGKGRPSVKIFRKFCLQCMGNHKSMVADCETKDCFCHPYRMGKNPSRQGMGDASKFKTRALSGAF
jgi:hypothetical protein